MTNTTNNTNKFFNAEYFATERANARMMDTTIWQACKILGIEAGTCRNSEVFHKLFNLYLEEELAQL